VAVTVTTPGGTSGAVPGGYTYLAVPTVEALTPDSGPLEGSTGVVLSGAGFVSGATTVTIGGTVVTPSAVTATSLTFDAPAGLAGTVTVTVATPGGTSGSVPGGYTYLAPPTITSLSPSLGSTEGGTTVVISGSGLSGTTTLTFGGLAATSFTVDSDTQITAVAPAHTVETYPTDFVDVVVSRPAGSYTATDAFGYGFPPVPGPKTPDSGTTAGGTSVIIQGANLADLTRVTFGGIDAQITFDSPTRVVVLTPAHAAGEVVMEVFNVYGSASVGSVFNYVEIGP
jgi:hypothetical protein